MKNYYKRPKTTEEMTINISEIMEMARIRGANRVGKLDQYQELVEKWVGKFAPKLYSEMKRYDAIEKLYADMGVETYRPDYNPAIVIPK